MRSLLVGVGNAIRRDDGAGPAVLERIACRKLVVHQLLPEHTTELAGCDRVLFVDAAVGGELTAAKVSPAAASPALGHTGSPAWLLALCEHLYGRTPEAWLLTVPGSDFGYGEGLSPPAERAVAAAAELVREWLNRSAEVVPPSASG